MAAATRYIGINCVILFGATTISNDFTSLDIDFDISTDERTAGNDAFKSYNSAIRGGKFALKILDPAESFAATLVTMRPGATGTLSIYSRGQSTGRPQLAFPAMFTGFKESVKPDKNVEIDFDGLINGQPTFDIGSVQ